MLTLTPILILHIQTHSSTTKPITKKIIKFDWYMPPTVAKTNIPTKIKVPRNIHNMKWILPKGWKLTTIVQILILCKTTRMN